jgi:hypothetical protein
MRQRVCDVQRSGQRGPGLHERRVHA